jgi:hypothetical protein
MWVAMTCERGCNISIPIHETSVVVAEPDEAAKVVVGGEGRPVTDCCYLARVDRQLCRRDPVAQEAQLFAPNSHLQALAYSVS